MARDYTIKRVPKNAKSKIDYANELNEKQFAAVTAPPGPALVIAGAGSGKTRTLIYRVAYLLDNGISARNILLLTFTNKAAREMLDRVEQLVPQDTHDLWGGTFHSVGNRILRGNAERLGIAARKRIRQLVGPAGVVKKVRRYQRQVDVPTFLNRLSTIHRL